MHIGPDPDSFFPNPAIPSLCFIKNIITNPRIIVGDYSYYEDPAGGETFESHVSYMFPELHDRLIIGKFCAMGRGIEFIMNGANHRLNSVTSYPFSLLANGWESAKPSLDDLPYKGDTVIGNDVWIGQNVTILPGIHIGDGAIITANAIVTRHIPPYHIAGGNPSRIIRPRFDQSLIDYLLELKWWDWPAKKIFDNLGVLCSGDLEKIRDVK